jgi:hypothetical protein
VPQTARTWKYRALLESRELRRGSRTTPGGLPRSLLLLFEPHTILPSQWDDRSRRARPARGAYALWLRVLADGVEDYLRPKPDPTTVAWVDARGMWLGSFDFLCELFGLNAEVVRRALDEQRRRRLVKSVRAGPRSPSDGWLNVSAGS